MPHLPMAAAPQLAPRSTAAPEVAAPRPGARARPDVPLVCALALLALAVVAGPAPFLDRKGLATTFYDDAYYYFQIARNVAAGAGFTFDGIHPTSGVHPLWLFTLVPVFAIVPGELAPLRAVILLESILVGATVVVLYRTLHARIGRTPAACAALLLLAQPVALRLLRGGMESALVLFLLVVAWSRWLALDDDPEAPPSRWLRLGAWCALLFLARLEAALAVPVLLLLGRRHIARDPRRALALAAPLALCALLYFGWTRASFGTWGPVSALVKAHMGEQVWAGQTWTQRLALALYLPWIGDWATRGLLGRLGVSAMWAPAVSTVLLLAVLALAVRHRRALARGGVLFPLLTAGLMLLVDKLSVMLMLDWYRAPTLLATAAVGALLVRGRPRVARVTACVLAVICLARMPVAIWRAHQTWVPTGLQAADWLRARSIAGERAASWNAGLIGYYAGGNVVNLDGLVNDAAYLDEVVRGKALAEYLDRERIRWLADTTNPDGRLAPLVRRFPPDAARQVEARYRPVVTFTGACPPDEDGCRMLAIWEAADQ